MKKRILSLLLAFLMVVSILPMPTYAEGEPEQTQDHSGDVGKYVKLNEEITVFTVYGLSPSSGTYDTQTFWYDDFQTGTIFQISDWMMKDGQVWYRLAFYKGGTQGNYVADFPQEPWFRQTEAGEMVFLDTCVNCGKPDCGGHTWCDICQGYDCGIDHTQTQKPSLTDPVTSVKVTLDNLPEGVALKVEKDVDVSQQLAEFYIPAENLVFALDISLSKDGADYQIPATVKVPVAAEPGTKIGILHTHGDETSYLGIVEVQNDKTIEFETNGFSEFAGFTVDFHYEGVTFSIEGMTAVMLSDLFEAMGIDEDATQATAVVFSDNELVQVTQEGNDWRLTSLEAFRTEETLIITFIDGHTIIIDVTDATKVADYTFETGTTYTIPEENDDYIVIWIDRDQLPATVILQGHYKYTWKVDSADPNENYASFSKDDAKATITVNKNAPVGYKYSLRNSQFIGDRARGIIRVIESVKFRYNKGNIVTSTTTFPSTSGTKKIGTWSIADTSDNTSGRTNTFDISTTTPAAPGYTFVNWSYTDWQNETQTVDPGGTVRLDDSSINKDDRDYVDFTANWTKIPYKITYDEKGGSAVSDQDYNVETNLTLREAPKRDGYTFKGWKLSTKTGSWSAMTYSAGQNMSNANYGNITLEAQWEIISNAVTYEYTGTHYPNIPALPSTKYYNYNASVSVEAAPTLNGYTFSGWNTSDVTVSNGKFTMPNKTVLFSGYWTPNQYDLTFDYNGGKNSETGKPDNVTYTATYGWQDYYGVGGLNPVREGYTFNGWYTDPVAGDKIYGNDNICIPGTQYWNSNNEWIGTADVTFYAHWTVNSHNVTYSYSGDVPASAAPVPVVSGKVNYGTEVTIAANPAAVEGYTFSGWSVSGASVANGKFSMPDNDVTITGSWTVSKHTVTFKDNDGEVLFAKEYPYGTKAADIDVPDLSAGKKDAKYTYTFTGWDSEIADVTGDATYTATYTKVANSYTITWIFGNGAENKVEPLSFGSKITEPTAPTRSGYNFKGWSPAVPDTMPAENQTFTAQWEGKTYNLYVYATYGQPGKNEMYKVQYGKDYNNDLSKMIEVQTGVRLKGLYTAQNGGGTQIYDADAKWLKGTLYWDDLGHWKYAGDLTIYADWEKIKYTITYIDTLAGTTSIEEYDAWDTSHVLKSVENHDGYVFSGWKVKETVGYWYAGDVYASGSKTVGLSGNVTLETVWERSLVDLTITADTADSEQNFVFTVSGTRSDGVAFEPIDVVLCSENDFRVTIKDLPVGEYIVTEKDGWSWRESAVSSKNADLTSESETLTFDFGVVDKLRWLSGYSCKRKKGGG